MNRDHTSSCLLTDLFGRDEIDRESLDDYITQFIGNAPQKIAMNANRGAAV